MINFKVGDKVQVLPWQEAKDNYEQLIGTVSTIYGSNEYRWSSFKLGVTYEITELYSTSFRNMQGVSVPTAVLNWGMVELPLCVLTPHHIGVSQPLADKLYKYFKIKVNVH